MMTACQSSRHDKTRFARLIPARCRIILG
jgi:hypothetical protein